MITIDKEFKYPIYSKVCSKCKHLKDYGKNRTCIAFPKGIPDIIWLGDDKHNKPLLNQSNDIVFKKI